MFTDNEMLRTKLIDLDQKIVSMCHPIYRGRPTCAVLLSEYNKWGIFVDQIKDSPEFKIELNQAQISNNTFFNNYMTDKLK